MKEHDIVVFIRPVTEGTVTIPIGAHGTIVHEYSPGKAYAVEIADGPYENEVVTADADCLKIRGN